MIGRELGGGRWLPSPGHLARAPEQAATNVLLFSRRGSAARCAEGRPVAGDPVAPGPTNKPDAGRKAFCVSALVDGGTDGGQAVSGGAESGGRRGRGPWLTARPRLTALARSPAPAGPAPAHPRPGPIHHRRPGRHPRHRGRGAGPRPWSWWWLGRAAAAFSRGFAERERTSGVCSLLRGGPAGCGRPGSSGAPGRRPGAD
jgi:hypothetical protein